MPAVAQPILPAGPAMAGLIGVLAGRSGDRQLCYNRGIVDFLGSRGYAMSVLRPQPIAEQEKEARAWRERFVQNAVANVRLEGLEPSPKALEIWQRYIEGEVSVEQAGELIRALPTGV
jgi:Antitoxin VbhA